MASFLRAVWGKVTGTTESETDSSAQALKDNTMANPYRGNASDEEDHDGSFHTALDSPLDSPETEIIVNDLLEGEENRPSWILPASSEAEPEVEDVSHAPEVETEAETRDRNANYRARFQREDAALLRRQTALINRTIQESLHSGGRRSVRRSQPITEEHEESSVQSQGDDSSPTTLGSSIRNLGEDVPKQGSDPAAAEFLSRVQRWGIRTPPMNQVNPQAFSDAEWKEPLPPLPRRRNSPSPDLRAIIRHTANQSTSSAPMNLQDPGTTPYYSSFTGANYVEMPAAYRGLVYYPLTGPMDQMSTNLAATPNPPGYIGGRESQELSTNLAAVPEDIPDPALFDLQPHSTEEDLIRQRMPHAPRYTEDYEISAENHPPRVALQSRFPLLPIPTTPNKAEELPDLPLRNITNNPGRKTTGQDAPTSAGPTSTEPRKTVKASTIAQLRPLTSKICKKYYEGFMSAHRRSPLSEAQLRACIQHNQSVIDWKEKYDTTCNPDRSKTQSFDTETEIPATKSTHPKESKHRPKSTGSMPNAPGHVQQSAKSIATDLLTGHDHDNLIPANLPPPLEPQVSSPQLPLRNSATARLRTVLQNWRNLPNLYRDAGCPYNEETTLYAMIRLLRKCKADKGEAENEITRNLDEFYTEGLEMSETDFDAAYERWKEAYKKRRDLEWEYDELLDELVWVFGGNDNLPGGLATEFVASRA